MAVDQLTFTAYQELLGVVEGLCRERRTGTLFAITDINSLARVVIVAGNVIYLEYRLKKGVDAVPLLREIRHGTLDFKEGKIIAHESFALPPTDELLQMLAGKAFVPPPAPAAPDHSRAFAVIEEELIEVLGPMGSLVWEEHLERAGGPKANPDLAALLNAVAAEIDDPRKAAQFRERVRTRLA